MRRKTRRGFVLVTMALAAVAVFGAAGLAVDLGRMMVVKNEVQVYCDAAAEAAALALDGTSTGLTRAQSAVTASPNKWNFGTAAVSNPAVTFATSSNGPWVTSPSPASGYSYVQVSATVNMQLYFIPLVTGHGSYNVITSARAAQVPITSLGQGVAPYTAVSTNASGPDFGFTVGSSYTIHWPTYNGNRKNCDPDHPDNCFNDPPCSGDSSAAMTAVVSSWGSQYHGYWGSNSNSVIAQEVLNAIQLTPVSVGMNLDSFLTPGNKQAEAGILDERVNQDTNKTDNTPAAYLGSSNHNGRRLLPVAVVNPVDQNHTFVTGFGTFLLQSNGSNSDYYKKNTNGNSPYCAMYVGPYNLGSSGPGTGGSTGAQSVKLVP